MKTFVLLSLLPSLLFIGCSGSEEAADELAEDPVEEAPAAVVETKQPKATKPAVQPAADISHIVEAIRTDIKAKRWDDVSIRMGVLNGVPKTPEQEAVFRQLVTEAQSEMINAMNSGSPEARRAYQRYGVMATGR